MTDTKIGFVGFGLIGGSIARAMRSSCPHIQIHVYTRRKNPDLEAGVQEGVIDRLLYKIDESFSDFDIIFLCAPVLTNIEMLHKLKPLIHENCIITDVGSVKGNIHKEAALLGMEKNFIGGHPMAGSEKTGLSNATAYLLENAYYIITPSPSVNGAYVKEFRDFVKTLGAIPMILDYDSHDAATAAISHLPHVIAATLVNLVKRLDDPEETMKTIAAGGFKDITRIASSSPVMWEEICMANKDQILFMLDDFAKSLSSVRSKIAACDAGRVRGFFQSAKDYRDSLAVSPKGSSRAVFELYCDLIDEAGGIATIATILASNNLSIKNIGIIHNREFEEGVLKIEMYDQDAYERAISLLRKYHYTVYQR